MKSTKHKTVLATGVRESIPSDTSCSHLINRSYKFRIYPNREQRELLEKHFGCCRFAYNYSELTLKDREWACPNCGSVIDRDYNAALNIRDEGMRILSGGGSPSDVKQKRAEAAA